MRRTREQWQALIQEQCTSEQTISAFCQERGLNPHYFSCVKSKLSPGESARAAPTFIKMPTPTLTRITLEHSGITLHIPLNHSPEWVAQLIRALS